MAPSWRVERRTFKRASARGSAVRRRVRRRIAQARRREVARDVHELPRRDRVGGHEEGKAYVVRIHHNAGGLPEQMKLGFAEPPRELFRDEVRRLGLEL
jgi:hypothetical protein